MSQDEGTAMGRPNMDAMEFVRRVLDMSEEAAEAGEASPATRPRRSARVIAAGKKLATLEKELARFDAAMPLPAGEPLSLGVEQNAEYVALSNAHRAAKAELEEALQEEGFSE
jgi:hypothetical protein